MLRFLSGEVDVDGPGQGHGRLAGGYPPYSEDIAMGLSSRFFSGLAVVISSFALLTCGPAMSQTTTAATTPSLPSITVQAPKQIVRPQRPQQTAKPPQRPTRVANRVASRPTSPTTPFTAAQASIMAKIRRLEKISGSCVGGCVTSFRSGDKPWIGCSASGWPAYSLTCRNVHNYKSYTECTETQYFLQGRPMDVHWYCTSLAFNK
jgi:hypothetical protein